jgi:hypothetical protein
MKKTQNLVITQRSLRLCVRIFEGKLDLYRGQNEYDIEH